MCRLAYIPAGTRPAWLLAYLHQLEDSLGGDGNGVAVGDACRKGRRVSLEAVLRFMEKHPGAALFHTRAASSGGISDALCHPFWTGRGWLAHNGHWVVGASAAEVLGAITSQVWSDSRVFAWCVRRRGFAVACAKLRPSGVWLHMTPRGRLSFFMNGGPLYYHVPSGIIGSEPFVPSVRQWRRLRAQFYSQAVVARLSIELSEEDEAPDPWLQGERSHQGNRWVFGSEGGLLSR